MHLLLIMTPDDNIYQTEVLEDLISSEIPDIEDLQLGEFVLNWMSDNPCGEIAAR